MSMPSRVVVTGAGLVSALGDSPAALYAALCEGRSGVAPLEFIPADGLSCRHAAQMRSFDGKRYLDGNLHPLSRLSQMVTAAAKLALESSGWTAQLTSAEEVCMSLGTMFGSVYTIAELDRRALTVGPSYVRPVDFANSVLNAAAGQAAIWHNLRGANSTISTGLTSGLQAIAMGVDMIQHGGARAVLAGGVDELCFQSLYAFDRASLLCACDADGLECPTPFDRRRNGLILGEASALLMLEDGDSAKGRSAAVLGEIRGFASGYEYMGWKDRSRAVGVIARTILSALDAAHISPRDIDAVSASANGSKYLDDVEAWAIAAAFGDKARTLPVTAIASMTGETLGAAGAMQTITMLGVIGNGVLPGVRGFAHPPDGFPLALVAAEGRPVKADYCLINSVGLDGDCFALVLARPGLD